MWSQIVCQLNDSLLSSSLWQAGQGAGGEGETSASTAFIYVGSCLDGGLAGRTCCYCWLWKDLLEISTLRIFCNLGWHVVECV